MPPRSCAPSEPSPRRTPGSHFHSSWCALRLLLAALAGWHALSAHASEPTVDLFPRAAAGYMVAINGRPRWARAPDSPRAPASLTKVLTALVVLEANWQPHTQIVVSPRAARAPGARLGLRPGDRAYAVELLEAMLVASANDACFALAEAVAGSAQKFVARMNERVATLGMTASHFEDPCGFDQPRQVTTPNDLLRLTKAALAMPAFTQAIAQERGEVHTLGGRKLTYTTSNLLLGRLDGALGVKTGHTSNAGRCLIGLATRGTTQVIVVLLDAPDRWGTAAVLIEEAFRAAQSG
jgi:D-alanyl-D-alanine carboxypeptidase (penicillin-binding protein 5/6)